MNKEFFSPKQFTEERARILRKINECPNINKQDKEYLMLEINHRELPTPALVIPETKMSPMDDYNFASEIIKLSQKADDNNWDDVTGFVSRKINDLSRQQNAIRIMTDDEIETKFPTTAPKILTEFSADEISENSFRQQGAKVFRDSLLEQLNKPVTA